MNKNVIITGAAGGIGIAMVETFASEGHNIWACARSESLDFEHKLKLISETTRQWIKPVYFDMSNPKAIKMGIESILSEKKPIDILINNAGTSSVGLLNQTKIDSIRELFEVNFFSMLEITQLVSRRMVRQRNGNIVNIASLAGIEPQPGKIAYGSSKAAVIMMTKCLAKELGPFGIRVNAIAPGPIDTVMINQYSDELKSKLQSEASLKRLGKTEEIAKTAVFLASDNASYISGSIIRVDGGR